MGGQLFAVIISYLDVMQCLMWPKHERAQRLTVEVKRIADWAALYCCLLAETMDILTLLFSYVFLCCLDGCAAVNPDITVSPAQLTTLTNRDITLSCTVQVRNVADPHVYWSGPSGIIFGRYTILYSIALLFTCTSIILWTTATAQQVVWWIFMSLTWTFVWLY